MRSQMLSIPTVDITVSLTVARLVGARRPARHAGFCPLLEARTNLFVRDGLL